MTWEVITDGRMLTQWSVQENRDPSKSEKQKEQDVGEGTETSNLLCQLACQTQEFKVCVCVYLGMCVYAHICAGGHEYTSMQGSWKEMRHLSLSHQVLFP